MSNILRKMYRTSKTLEETGVVLEYGDGVEVMVARAGGANRKYAKVLSRLTRPHRAAIQNEVLDETLGQEIMYQTYAQAVVKGWKGITKDILTNNDEDAEVELECTEENIIAVFKALPDLYEDIKKMSDSIAMFREETNSADSGN